MKFWIHHCLNKINLFFLWPSLVKILCQRINPLVPVNSFSFRPEAERASTLILKLANEVKGRICDQRRETSRLSHSFSELAGKAVRTGWGRDVPGEPGQSAEGRTTSAAWSWQLAPYRRMQSRAGQIHFYYSGFRGTPGSSGGKLVQESYYPVLCFRSANFMVGCRITEQLKEQARSTEQEGTTNTWLLPARPVVQIQTGCMFPHWSFYSFATKWVSSLKKGEKETSFCWASTMCQTFWPLFTYSP